MILCQRGFTSSKKIKQWVETKLVSGFMQMSKLLPSLWVLNSFSWEMMSNPIFPSLATNAWKSICMTIQSVFLQTIKSIQPCIGIECYKILRFPKRCERKKHMFFFKMWFTNACPPHVLVYFIPYHIQLTKSSLPGVVWPWSLVCHCGWVWFYMKAQLSWWPGSLARW